MKIWLVPISQGHQVLEGHSRDAWTPPPSPPPPPARPAREISAIAAHCLRASPPSYQSPLNPSLHCDLECLTNTPEVLQRKEHC